MMAIENRYGWLLTDSILHNAAAGDIQAIEKIIHFYRGYITKLATKVLTDDNGDDFCYVDEQRVRHLETKLISLIMLFERTYLHTGSIRGVKRRL